jgi:hypothetical protein
LGLVRKLQYKLYFKIAKVNSRKTIRGYYSLITYTVEGKGIQALRRNRTMTEPR